MDNQDKGRLVLGVKEGEPVYVGNDVEVVVNGFTGKVNLVFTAPKTIKIYRAKCKEEANAQRHDNFRSS